MRGRGRDLASPAEVENEEEGSELDMVAVVVCVMRKK
jgi:hypothetical protein